MNSKHYWNPKFTKSLTGDQIKLIDLHEQMHKDYIEKFKKENPELYDKQIRAAKEFDKDLDLIIDNILKEEMNKD